MDYTLETAVKGKWSVQFGRQIPVNLDNEGTRVPIRMILLEAYALTGGKLDQVFDSTHPTPRFSIVEVREPSSPKERGFIKAGFAVF
jgi:hypothetical protein